MRKSLILLAAVGAVASVGSASAQLRPAPLGEIYESYNDCFAVATPDGFRPAALEGLGWRRGQREPDRSAGVPSPAVYAHGSRRPVILLDAAGAMCIVTARLEDAGKFEEFKQAWGGQLPPPSAEGVIFFRAEGRMIRLARTGTAEAPSLSIAVMAPTEN